MWASACHCSLCLISLVVLKAGSKPTISAVGLCQVIRFYFSLQKYREVVSICMLSSRSWVIFSPGILSQTPIYCDKKRNHSNKQKIVTNLTKVISGPVNMQICLRRCPKQQSQQKMRVNTQSYIIPAFSLIWFQPQVAGRGYSFGLHGLLTKPQMEVSIKIPQAPVVMQSNNL